MDVKVHWSEVGNNSMHKIVLDQEVSLIKNDVDDNSVAKKVHEFYFVKFYEDQELKARLEKAENVFSTLSKNLLQISIDVEEKKIEITRLTTSWYWRQNDVTNLSYNIEYKKDELKSLQQALNRLSFSKNANRRGRRNELYSSTKDSVKKRNDLKLNYRMLHECNNLAEEKKILREIKQLEGTWEQQLQSTKAHQLEGTRWKFYMDSLGSRKEIRERIRLKEMELEGIRKRQREGRAKINSEFEEMEKDIVLLEKERIRLNQQRAELHDYIIELRERNEAANVCCYEYLSVLNHARVLAKKNDLAALVELSSKEADKFMSQWSNNNAFKNDYVKRILPSLDWRDLSRDGLRKTPKRSLRLQKLHPNML